jgi:hypothetical protein
MMADSVAPTTIVTYHKFEPACFSSCNSGHIWVSLTILTGDNVHWILMFLKVHKKRLLTTVR